MLAANVEMNEGTSALQLSRWTSLALLLTYIAYLVFQLKTHTHLYQESPTPSSSPQATPIGNAVLGINTPAPGEDEEEEVPVFSFYGALRESNVAGAGVVIVATDVLL